MEHIILVNVQEAKSKICLQNYKSKVLKTKADIWFDKMCRINELNPKYINIAIKGNKQQGINAKRMATTYRITQNQSAFVGLLVHFIQLINALNMAHIKLICFCGFVKYSPH
jgi:hypothetical protein